MNSIDNIQSSIFNNDMNPLKRVLNIADQYRISNGDKFRLKDIDPGDTAGLKSDLKDEAQELLQQSVKHLADLQDKLYAQDRWALLLIFQAMDAAGKDGTIKHVMSGLNPQGVDVHPFKAPSPEELDHDYLWRGLRVLPERGRIGIFNRSYYEETLVVRVHRNLLGAEKIPEELVTKNIWKERFKDICHFEQYLANNGIIVRKFFLHVSKKEQKKRFLERLDKPEKNWKFSAADLKERQCWNDYQDAYEDMIRHTATKHAPWYVVPADNKWFTRLVVAAAVTDTLRNCKLAYPTVSAEQKTILEQAKRQLLKEK
jgi:PPK2 family polyphosphate:nucleotide phosphotransferase